jgi:hypothetical protein
MKKVIIFTSALVLNFYCSFAQTVETVISHPKIVDGLYVDGQGNVFTTSGGLVNGTEIGKYDIQTKTYDPNFAVGFAGPINIAPYRDSLLIVSNYDNNTVYSYNLNTSQIKTIASGLDGPSGITIDSNDNIYVANWGQAPAYAGHQIHKISSSGVVSVFADSSALYRPQAITINETGELLVHSKQTLYKVNLIDGSLSSWVAVGYQIGNMVFRKKDSCIYGASNQRNKIIKIDALGGVNVFSGSTPGYLDGNINDALFNKPLGIAFSTSEDTLYISEAGNVNRLRRIIMNQTVNVEYSKFDSALKISPNPSNDVFTIELEKEKKITMEVFNSAAKLISSQTLSAKKILLNLSNYPTGVYIIRLSYDKKTIAKEIVKI